MEESKFDSHLREARIQKGYSQEHLARDANVSKETIRNIEKGHSVPNVLLGITLAGLLGWAVHELFKERGSDDNGKST